MTSATAEPITSPTEASLAAKASTKLLPWKKPPVYIMPTTHPKTSSTTGTIKSDTRPVLASFRLSSWACLLLPVVKRSPLRALFSCNSMGP